ncbi:MAG: undecaprenyldiphospho-muramoylpentapeptide beta-N-acetylglucosaminyltransferase [SAR324 cluster bacterium]|nr:undecaprenyldiphospho-muramoylpentapeptide beta-N-acetylglucosaminyltransferase [SAR324 cluster bacterium]
MTDKMPRDSKTSSKSAASPKPLRLLVAGGGTGGHLFPAIAIAQALQNKLDLEIRFVGSDKGIEATKIPALGFRLYKLQVAGLYRVGKVKKILSLLKLPIAFLQSLAILLTYRPNLVLGVGGYASGPLLLVALFLGFKVVLQEQNASPGMTNRFLGRYAPLTLAPFAGLEEIFKNPVVVGNPIRKEIIAVAAQNLKKEEKPTKEVDFRPNFDERPFHIAIVGGTQGARVINRAFCGLLDNLKNKKVKITHQAGKLDFEEVTEIYKNYPHLDAEVTIFIDDMADLYQNANLIISRAGSMVAEFNAMGRASILIPIPQASGDHQKQNALKLAEAGAAVLLEQKDLTPKSLLSEIEKLWGNPEALRKMEKASQGLFNGDAAAQGADVIIQFFELTQFSKK